MALLIDTLFSGSKVDRKFACTGGIAPNGTVTRCGAMLSRNRYDHGDAVVKEAKESLLQLKELDGRVHAKFRDFLESTIAIGEMMASGAKDDDKEQFIKDLGQKFGALRNLQRKLSSDPELLEETMG